MVSFEQHNNSPSRNFRCASVCSVEEDETKTTNDALSRDPQPKSCVEPDPALYHKEPEFFAKVKNPNPTEHGLGGPSIESDDSVAGDESFSPDRSFSHDPGDGKTSFTSYRETPETEEHSEEYIDDDEGFLSNTRDQTRKEDVLKLKEDIIRERNQAREARNEHVNFISAQQRIWADIHLQNEARLQKERQRRAPQPPKLGSKTYQPLYDGTIDRLKECTLQVLINRSRNNYDMGEWMQSEHHARQAHDKYAAQLDYEPLSAWCQFHIGKALYGQRKYEEAALAMEEARKAVGLYVRVEVVGEWESRIGMADGRMVRGSMTGSTESLVGLGESLEDELVGVRDSGSEDGFD